MAPPIEALCSRIEGIVREVQGMDDLIVVKFPRKFEYADSLDPEGKLPFIYVKEDNPAKDEPGYPRLQLENRCYSTRVFEKIHLELAVRQDGLQVFHCVMLPRPQFALPILGMDVVAMAAPAGDEVEGSEAVARASGSGPPSTSAGPARVSLAIVDPSPVSWNLQLPEWYQRAVTQLQSDYDAHRKIPDWGRDIFSESCVAIRPENGRELASFITYACTLTRVHMTVAKTQEHLIVARGQQVAEVKACHKRYAEKQLKNDKTRRVLEASFGASFAEEYMTTVMFPAAKE